AHRHLASDGRWTERDDFGHFQSAVPFVLEAVESQTEPGGGRSFTAPAASPAAACRDAHVRRVQLTHHQAPEPAPPVRRLGAAHPRRVLRGYGVLVHAVELRVVEAVAEVGPGLPEDLHLLVIEIHVHLGGYGDRSRLAGVDGYDREASLFEVVDLAAVRRE